MFTVKPKTRFPPKIISIEVTKWARQECEHAFCSSDQAEACCCFMSTVTAGGGHCSQSWRLRYGTSLQGLLNKLKLVLYKNKMKIKKLIKSCWTVFSYLKSIFCFALEEFSYSWSVWHNIANAFTKCKAKENGENKRNKETYIWELCIAQNTFSFQNPSPES